MDKFHWNNKLESLEALRNGWLNDDYLQFVVSNVWNIHSPVKMIDFGCGFGYLGLLLLPILPKGSTYKGIDFSDVLLNKAREMLADYSEICEFEQVDVDQYQPKIKYDIAICHAFLRHLSNAKETLGKIRDSVAEGGLVVCMETDLVMEKAGQFVSGLSAIDLCSTKLRRKMYENELAMGKRDFRTGIKIPIWMQELGLKDIKVRVSDCVKFLNPHDSTTFPQDKFEAMYKSFGCNQTLSSNELADFKTELKKRGLSEKEAHDFIRQQENIAEHIADNKDSTFIVQAPCTIISSGTVCQER